MTKKCIIILMVLYVLTVTIGLTLSGLLNTLLFDVAVPDFFVWTGIGILSIAVVAFIPHFAVRVLPKRLFMPERKYYQPRNWEDSFYRFLRVKSWKDKLPDAGAKVSGFGKRHLKDSSSEKYLYKFLVETCYAEVVHLISAFGAFLALIFVPIEFFQVVIPVFLLNFVLHMLPVISQRYLRPKLYRVYSFKKAHISNNEETPLQHDNDEIKQEMNG